MSIFVELIQLIPAMLIGLAAGIWLSFRNIQKAEKATPQAGQLLLHWNEEVGRQLIDEPKFGLVVVCDFLATSFLAVTIDLILAQAMITDPNGPIRLPGYAGIYENFLWWFGTILAWCWVGILVPLFIRYLQPRNVEVSVFEEGVKCGAVFAGWKRFGGYRIHEDGRQIDLFSMSETGMSLLSLRPAEPGQFGELKQILLDKVVISTRKRGVPYLTASIGLALAIGGVTLILLAHPSYTGAILAIGLAWLLPYLRQAIFKYYGLL